MMERYMRYTFLIALLLLLSCQQEDLIKSQSNGYLSLEDVNVSIVNVNGIKTKAGIDANLGIEIWKDGSLYENHKYQPGTSFTNKIELPVGSYLLKAYTPNYETSTEVLFADSSLGEAIYYTEQIFQIEAAKVTYPNVLVPMINVGVQLKDNLPTEFSKYVLKATVGGRTIEIKPGEIGYFPITAVGSSLSYALNAMNTDNEPMESGEKVVSLLDANTIYEIAYSFSSKSFNCFEL